MNARVGPVRATFAGGVLLTDVDAPNHYTLVGEGKGGVAGFAKGSAAVTLADATVAGRPGTRLQYNVTSSVGGKLAQLGARLIEGTARGYADTFFTRLKAEVEDADATVVPPPITPATTSPSAASHQVDDAQRLHDNSAPTGLTPLVWGGIIVVVVLAVLVWQLA